MESGWFQNQLRGIFASINYCIYSLIEWIMQGIFDIAYLELNTGLLNDVYMRVYVFLGIFMTFKITISLLKYMANPDSINDKEKGAGKLVSKTITMLVLLILLPNVFPLLREAQQEFLPILPRIILGQENDNSDSVNDNASLMATTALSAFFAPCRSCDPADRPEPITSIDDMTERYKDSSHGIYEYDFNYIWAMVVGVVIALILVMMTIKIGIRLFKMFILEIIAPIPIMSYIDPKSSKDGAFAAWVKQLTSTFLDIFFRLGIIYVVLVLLSALATDNLLASNTIPSDPVRKGYLFVFLIIALLMFAKDAPNFIKDAFGIKHDKDTSGALAAVTGAVTGAGAGFVSGMISGRGIRGGITGAATGIGAGVQSGMTGKKVSAWQTAGDAAIQARTGDSKAKSGVLAALQTSASKSQMAREGRKLNLTYDTIEEAKSNMLEMQGMAAEAQRNWEYGVQTGDYRDLEGNAITMDEATNIVTRTSIASSKATKNYEKMNKAGDVYGVNLSYADDLNKERKDTKVDYKRGKVNYETYKATGKANPKKGYTSRSGT